MPIAKRADRESDRALLAGLAGEHIYEAALSLMMRLVFLFFAEERDLLPITNPVYRENYAVSTLHDQLHEAADRLGEEALDRRYDAFGRAPPRGYAVLGGARQPTEQVVATVGKPMLARVAELQYQLLAKPVPNQPQMVELVPRTPLVPGLYVASYSPEGKAGWVAWFAVASPDAAEQPYCVDLVMMGGYGGMFFNANSELTQTAPLLTKEHYRTCNMNQGAAAPAGRVVDNTPAVASCTDYESCIKHGVASFRSAAFGQALADFKKAAEQNPKMAIPWMWVGNSQLAMGQLEQFRAAWDKVLELKTALPVPACREKSVQTCDMGDLQIGPENVAFLVKGQTIFDVPASQVNVRGTTVYRPGGITIPHISFGIDVGKKKYNFSVSPYGIGCNVHSILACPQQGMDQQAAISNYLAQAIARIASAPSGTAPQAASATPETAMPER